MFYIEAKRISDIWIKGTNTEKEKIINNFISINSVEAAMLALLVCENLNESEKINFRIFLELKLKCIETKRLV